jgi:hypothetical protein
VRCYRRRMQCPRCQVQDEPRPIGFTWWGGLLGPKLLHHVECTHCRARFNGRTGRSNDTAIAIYMIAIGAVAFMLVFALMRT